MALRCIDPTRLDLSGFLLNSPAKWSGSPRNGTPLFAGEAVVFWLKVP